MIEAGQKRPQQEGLWWGLKKTGICNGGGRKK
jgi:hypothetical protein